MSIDFDPYYKYSNRSTIHYESKQHPRTPFPPRRFRLIPFIGIAILLLIYYVSPPQSLSLTEVPGTIDWSKFAYSQYATDSATLCNAIMVFEALERLGSKADRVLLFPEQWDLTVEGPKDRDSQLLNLARDQYNVKLHPIEILAVAGSSQPGTFDHPQESWDTSITKLLAFNLTFYDRVLHLDNDVTLFQHLDELFLLPPTPVAMPRAYWLPEHPHTLTSLLLLVTPSPTELTYLLTTLAHQRAASSSPAFLPSTVSQTTDMDLLNARFGASALVLPHRPYALLSGEFRQRDHSAYLGTASPATASEVWDADVVRAEAKLVHFSDWPLPKPWIMWPWEGLAEMQPECARRADGADTGGCRERVIWKELYEEFRGRRKEVCRLLSVPAPEWRLLKKGIQKAQGETEERKEMSSNKDKAGKDRKTEAQEAKETKQEGNGSQDLEKT
ncbi:MAG: N-acetylglucosaminyltransferase [Bathelium mastoideum]|nr:MAG: N-acetylglucosaminyltransferase [Bathelium mastoideum]